MFHETFRPAFDEPAANLPFMPIDPSLLPTPNISYGLPYPEACAKHVHNTFHCSKVYIICSGTLSRDTDALERLIAALGKEYVVGVKKGMVSHTMWSEIMEIMTEAREAKADCLVTLGAGSLTDGAKIVVMALANDIQTTSQLADYSIESKNPQSSVKPPTIPLICIPTSLSGGEYFSLAGGTDDKTHHKQGFIQPGMGAKLVILDAELCLLTPPYYWLSTGVRSLDHCVECLCSLQSTPTADKDAEEGLRLLVPSLLKCKSDPKDVEARHKCHMAVLLAMKGIRAGVPMGGSHAIGHQLGPLGVPHGVTSCIMCPAVMKYNITHAGNRVNQQKQTKVLSILWSEMTVAELLKKEGLKQENADLGDVLDVIIRELGLPRTLKQVGIEKSQFPPLSKRTLDDFCAQDNPVPLTQASQVSEILEAVAG